MRLWLALVALLATAGFVALVLPVQGQTRPSPYFAPPPDNRAPTPPDDPFPYPPELIGVDGKVNVRDVTTSLAD